MDDTVQLTQQPASEVVTPDDYDSYLNSLTYADLDDEVRQNSTHYKKRLIPALRAMKKRYSQPGRRKEGELPTWEQYLDSLGLRARTVRSWLQPPAIPAASSPKGTNRRRPGGDTVSDLPALRVWVQQSIMPTVARVLATLEASEKQGALKELFSLIAIGILPSDSAFVRIGKQVGPKGRKA